MISGALRLTLSVAVICYFILILVYLKKQMLDLKYTLLWLFAGGVMGVMIFAPETLVYFVRLLGIESNMNGLYVLCIAFTLAILMSLTAIVSRQSQKIKQLIQNIAILEKRIRELESETKGSDSHGEKVDSN